MKAQRLMPLAEADVGKQMLAIDVAAKGARLLHEPVNQMPVIDAGLVSRCQRARQYRRAAAKDADLMFPSVYGDLCADQARRHRVRDFVHTNRAFSADGGRDLMSL